MKQIRVSHHAKSIALLTAIAAAGICQLPSAGAALYYDTSTAANLQGGNATWDVGSTAVWSSGTAGSNPLLTWTNGSQAYFYGTGVSTVTISGTVSSPYVTNQNGSTTTIDGGTLTLTGAGNSVSAGGIQNTANPFTVNASVIINTTGGGATFSANASLSLTLNGAISEATSPRSITVSGPGTVTLSNSSNSYTGVTNINAGTLKISGGNDRLPTGTTLSLAGQATSGGNYGTFDLNGLNQTVAQLTGGAISGTGTTYGTITNNVVGTSLLTVTGTSQFDGIIKDASSTKKVALTKGTGGVLTLTGVNTYTGATDVTGGSLVVNGSLGSTAVTVNGTTAILAGKGTIGGSVNLANGTLSPGNGDLSALTVNSSVTLGAGSAFIFNLGTSPSDGNAKLSMAGQTLTLNGQQISDFTFNHSGSWTAGNYVLIDAGSLSGDLGSLVSMNPTAGVTLTLEKDIVNNDLVLAVSVPEPATASLVFAMASLALMARRRRTSSVAKM